MNRCLTIVFVFFITLAANVYAQEHNQTLKAHIHGLSELTLVTEGNQLEIQLTSPAMDLVGFEYEARTKEEVAIVENTASKLQQHDTLFEFLGATCKHITTSIETSDLIKNKHHHNVSQGHNEHENNEEHPDLHSEIKGHYQYTCEQAASLSSIKVGLFELFPNVHKIHTMWIKQNKQGSSVILAKKPFIQF